MGEGDRPEPAATQPQKLTPPTVLALTLFVTQHLYSWDWIHVLTVVLPGGLALTFTYLWKRSLMVNVIIHGGINFPFLVAAFFYPCWPHTCSL